MVEQKDKKQGQNRVCCAASAVFPGFRLAGDSGKVLCAGAAASVADLSMGCDASKKVVKLAAV